MAKRVLIIGGSGFVGRNMVDEFASDSSIQLSVPSLEELDALDERAVVNTLLNGSFDTVINCLDGSGATDAAYAESRLRMYHNFAHHSDLYGRMIYFGSGAEYNRAIPVHAVSEDDWGRSIPIDSYGFALFQMSQHALQSDNIYNLRLFGIFGPNELWSRRFISNMICRSLLGLPLIMRQDRLMDYLSTYDLRRIVRWIMNADHPRHAYNATSGNAYSLIDLAGMVCRELGISESEIVIAVDGQGPEYTSDNTLLREDMHGFTPMEMQESIRRLVEYYRDTIASIDREKLLFP